MSKTNQGKHSEVRQIERLRVKIWDPNLGQKGEHWPEISCRELAILWVDQAGLHVKGNVDNPLVLLSLIRGLAKAVKQSNDPQLSQVADEVIAAIEK